MQREHVIFFRHSSTEPSGLSVERDPYEAAMTSDRYIAHTQPVLGQEFVNENRLVEVLGDPDAWRAVVATSKRAGEAWSNAVRCRNAGKIGWGQVPLYTPGAGTTATFSSSDLPNSCFPTIVSESQETGCAEHLGPFIVSHITREGPRKEDSATTKPFLVLTGDKNSSELTDILQRNQVAYQELEVYRSRPLPDIAPRLTALLEDIVDGSARNPEQAITIWFAFFSPSSAEAVLQARPSSAETSQICHWHNDIARELEERYGKRIGFRMAAIGKTTGNYLRRQGFNDVVQAEKPNAEGMAKAIAKG